MKLESGAPVRLGIVETSPTAPTAGVGEVNEFKPIDVGGGSGGRGGGGGRIPDPGLPEFVERLKAAGIPVTSTNVEIYGEAKRVLGEVDVVTPKGLVQYKSARPSARDIIEQVTVKTEPHVTRPVFSFVDETGRVGTRAVRGATAHGVKATNDFDQMVRWLR